MNHDTIIQLYITHLIIPLETLIKNPDFPHIYSHENCENINQLLLSYYRHLELLLKNQI